MSCASVEAGSASFGLRARITALVLLASVPALLAAILVLPVSVRRDVPPETLAVLGPAPESGAWLVMLGYPACGDVCPLALAALRTVVQRSGERASSPGVTFVSTGTEHDSTAAGRLARAVHPHFRGVQVRPGELHRLAAVFGARAGLPAGPDLGHPTPVYLLARGARGWELRAVFPRTPPDPDRILRGLESL